MRAFLSQKLLPLALCFAVGVGLASAGQSARRAKRRGGCETYKAAAGTHSRTWLVIKSRPKPRPPSVVRRRPPLNKEHEFHSVRLRALFGADGLVSGVTPLSEMPPRILPAAIIKTVEYIDFIPATEDGRPLGVLADVTYKVDVSCECGDGLYGIGGTHCDASYVLFPFDLSLDIVSVEGAKEREGWRVVYE